MVFPYVKVGKWSKSNIKYKRLFNDMREESSRMSKLSYTNKENFVDYNRH